MVKAGRLMEQFNLSHYIAAIAIFFSLFFLLLTFLQKRKNSFLAQQLTQTTILLEATRKKLDKLQEKHEQILEFQNSLNVAELTTKFQKPRLDAQKTETNDFAPGRYSNVQSLTEKGMSADEIASTLAISTHEAHQLVNLAKLAKGNIA
jgi:hypothetical protein